MIFDRFKDVIYVRVNTDRIRARNVRTRQEVDLGAHPSFSHPRALLANFTIAAMLLKQAVRGVASLGWLRLAPQLVIHPLEKIEGGLTQIEMRAFQELALGAGAAGISQVKIWVGAELDDAQVLAQFKG